MKEKEKTAVVDDLVPKKKVCIIGCSDHKALAPWDDTDYYRVGVNNMFVSLTPEQIEKMGAWFEIHLIEKTPKQWLRRKSKEFRGQNVNDYVKMLGKLPCPVYMQKKWEEIPNAIEYPKDEVMNFWKTDYINNTISWELLLFGMLIHQGHFAPHMAVYGVDMATQGDVLGNPEYGHQKPSCEWALGLLAGSGITLELPKEADLLKVRWLYGWGEPEQTAWNAKIKNTKKAMMVRKHEAEQRFLLAQKQMEQYTGALQAIEEMGERLWR